MAKSRRGSRRAATAQRSVSRGHPAHRTGSVRTIRGGAGPTGRGSGAPSKLPAGATPKQLVEALQAAADPALLLAEFEDAGLLPSEEKVLEEILDGWASLLRPGCDPLDAELAGAEFLGLLRRMVPEDVDLAEVVTTMIGQVEASGTAEAMAMASVLAVLGPADVRSAASSATARLAAAGLATPQWAGGLGRPAIGKCFGYGDDFGEQENDSAVLQLWPETARDLRADRPLCWAVESRTASSPTSRIKSILAFGGRRRSPGWRSRSTRVPTLRRSSPVPSPASHARSSPIRLRMSTAILTCCGPALSCSRRSARPHQVTIRASAPQLRPGW